VILASYPAFSREFDTAGKFNFASFFPSSLLQIMAVAFSLSELRATSGERKKVGHPHFWCKKKNKVVDFLNGRFNFAG
jgi:hypothetical protein